MQLNIKFPTFIYTQWTPLKCLRDFRKISLRSFTHLTYQSDKNPLNDLARKFSTGRLSDLKDRFVREKLFLKIFYFSFAAEKSETKKIDNEMNFH